MTKRGAALLFDMGNVRYRQGVQSLEGEEDLRLVESYHLFTRAEAAFTGVDGPQSLDVADSQVMIARHFLRHGNKNELPTAR
jgi:hypothetical protein